MPVLVSSQMPVIDAEIAPGRGRGGYGFLITIVLGLVVLGRRIRGRFKMLTIGGVGIGKGLFQALSFRTISVTHGVLLARMDGATSLGFECVPRERFVDRGCRSARAP